MPVDETVLDFIGRLRAGGITVSLAESMDAVEALKVVPLDNIELFRSSLMTTLVKHQSDCPIFLAVFDDYFSGVSTVPATQDEVEPQAEDGGIEYLGPDELASMLRDVLVSGTDDEIAALARAAAAGIGRMEGGFGGGSRPLSVIAGSGYYAFRAMEWLKFRDMAGELEETAADGTLMPGVPPVLAVEEVRERLERFRLELEREIRRRWSAQRGKRSDERRRKLPRRPEEVDFTGASLVQVEEMRKILPGLARRLAARLARKNSAGRRGRVDIRNTLRHSLSSGGVPIDVKYRKRVPARPELFILCDVSGSVRTFSTFTLQLVYSLHQQFRAVRSFAFIDRVDEVSDSFDVLDVGEAVDRAYREADVVDGDGHSDVGRAIELFHSEYASYLSSRSTVLILSDARNNNKDPRSWALERVSEKTRRVYWLNPEPVERWNTGDSIMSEYEDHCHSVHECRNLKQLAEFVYRGS